MSPAYLLGSDIGSGSCKTLLTDTNGVVVGRAVHTYEIKHPQPGWSEYDADDWYTAFCATVGDVLRETRIDPAQIAAICIVGITHDPVILNDDGQPIYPAIHFNDQRSLEQCDVIRNRWGKQILDHTTNAISPLWTWPQLMWIRDHESEVWQVMDSIIFPKDYVRQRLTDSHHAVTDVIDAAGTLLYNPEQQQWIDDFVHDLELTPDILPDVRSPFDIISHVSTQGAQDTGLLAGTPVLVGTTDTAAEMLAVGAVRPGQGTLKLASVGRIAFISHHPVRNRHVLNYAHLLDDLWYPGTATKYAASAYRWLRESLWQDVPENSYQDMDRLAATTPTGGDGLLFLPHLMGQSAPQWDARLSGAFLGVGLQHHLGHFTRAVLEGVAFSMRDAFETMTDLGLAADELFLIGNGAGSPLWSQIMADVFNRTLLIPQERDAAYGAVLMAGIATGDIAHDGDQIRHYVKIENKRIPDEASVRIYHDFFHIYRAANDAIAPIAHRIHAQRIRLFDTQD